MLLGILITSGVPALCMQAARHSQRLENKVFFLRQSRLTFRKVTNVQKSVAGEREKE